MPAAAPTVVLGYVSRANGLRGAVVVHSDPSMAAILAKGLPVELRPRAGDPLRTRIVHSSQVSGGVRVAFEGVGDRNAAEALVGATLFVARDRLGGFAEGEYLDSDLVGLEVRTQDGRVLGRLVEVVATGANDVYVVTGADGAEVLVPAVAHAGIGVDLAAGTMTVAADALEYGGAGSEKPPGHRPEGEPAPREPDPDKHQTKSGRRRAPKPDPVPE